MKFSGYHKNTVNCFSICGKRQHRTSQRLFALYDKLLMFAVYESNLL